MNIIIFGSPGAGKGTQAKIIAESENLSHLSSGELSRQMVNNKEFGETIKTSLAKGNLVPNNIIIDIVEDYIIKNRKLDGFIFDGYPRNIGQAKTLDKLTQKENTKIDLVINLELDEKEALNRILKRGETSGRSDDNLKTIKNRLKVYKERTEPLLDYYKEQDKLYTIDGRKTIKQIGKDIKKIIKEYKQKERAN
ncbi:MAG: adenylate kinase [Patescibacteria group bacterium]|jgi:adenylate kinase|nr:adenylate kinase [Patescibacteria group bacterium]